MNLFVHTIQLSQPLQGQDIVQIIRSASETDRTSLVYRTFYREGGDSYQLGQSSMSPYKQFLVTPNGEGEEDLFAERSLYVKIVVTDHSWPAPVHAVGYDDKDVIDAGIAFVREIEKALGQGS